MAFLGRLLRGSPSVPLAAGEIPPKKVAWLNPWVLLQTGYHAWLVTAGSGILDRREVLAALNQFPRGGDPAFLPPVVGSGAHIDGYVPDTYRGQLGLDFMADVGDSWEATYSVASLLVEKDLRRRLPPTRGVQSASASRVDPFATKLGPGEVLILGGDLVYPRASRDAYRRRFCAPFHPTPTCVG